MQKLKGESYNAKGKMQKGNIKSFKSSQKM